MRLKLYLISLMVLCVITRLNAEFKLFTDNTIIRTQKKENPSELLLFTLGYKTPINKNRIINSGHGVYIEGGLNFGHLISKKTTLGLYVGWSFMDKLYSTSFNPKFSNDYENSIDKENNITGLDSIIINSSINLVKNTKGTSNLMPGCEMKSFHNYSMYYGIIFKAPFKYFPTLKIYKGTLRNHYQGDGNISTLGKDYNIFEFRHSVYGFEIMVLDLETIIKRKNKTQNKNRGVGLSIYYETINLNNSSLYFNDGETRRTISLKKYTSSTFLNKYNRENSFGIRVCYFIGNK
jgi:hypothetical protein